MAFFQWYIWVIVIRQTKHDSNAVYYFPDPTHVHVKTWEYHSATKSLLKHSIADDLYCLKAVDRNFVRNGGNITDAFVAVYLNKSLTMCSSDFVFQKYKQDSAFCVSGVLQLAKMDPPVTKNFPLLRLFLSDAWRFYTPYDVNGTNLHILTNRGMSHILTQIGQLWSSRKNSYTLLRSPNSKIMNQRIVDFIILK